MKQTIDMKCMRYLNLFERITGIRTKNCFFYNNFIIFAVQSNLISRVIGEHGKNVKKLSSILGRKIKIVSLPLGIHEAGKFIGEIISPLTFKNLEVSEKEIVISANKENKSSLIGRNKTRLSELNKIVQEFFGKDVKII